MATFYIKSINGTDESQILSVGGEVKHNIDKILWQEDELKFKHKVNTLKEVDLDKFKVLPMVNSFVVKGGN